MSLKVHSTSTPSSWGKYLSFWKLVCFIFYINYRLITAYLLLRVNLDKIMHARWDFDASSARTRRVSALDKHQNWSASALFCLNFRAQSKYAVVNLIHTRRKQSFFLLLCDKQDILVSLKVIQIMTNKIQLPVQKINQPYARVNELYATLTLASALHEMFGVQLYKNNARALLSRILSILNLDWLQHARSVRGVYEIKINTIQRTSSDFNENQPKCQNRNFLKTFCNHLWWNLYTTFI